MPAPVNERERDAVAAGRLVVIVANPYSGARENRTVVAKLEAALRGRGLEPRVMWELGELEASANEPGFGESCRAIIAAGGDGTMSAVINQHIGSPVAVLPLGTENLFAMNFGFTDDITALAERVAAGRTTTIDLGRRGDQYFSVVLSAGFDGDVAHRLARWRKREKDLKRVKRHTYLRPIAVSALKYNYPMMELIADGVTHRGPLVMIFNQPQYGFGFKLAPHADPADGKLDYLVFHRPGRVRLGLYWLSLMRQKHLERSDVTHGTAKKLELRSEQPVPMEMDGEPCGLTPCTVETIPAALRVIV